MGTKLERQLATDARRLGALRTQALSVSRALKFDVGTASERKVAIIQAQLNRLSRIYATLSEIMRRVARDVGERDPEPEVTANRLP